jgi:hypothetical protein
MRIAVLALEGLFDSGLAVMLDAFSTANALATRLMNGTPRIDVSVVGVRKRVRSGQGLLIPVKDISPSLKPDWVVVPALKTKTPEALIESLERPDVRQAKEQLVKWNARRADRLKAVAEPAERVVSLGHPTRLNGTHLTKPVERCSRTCHTPFRPRATV